MEEVRVELLPVCDVSQGAVRGGRPEVSGPGGLPGEHRVREGGHVYQRDADKGLHQPHHLEDR